MKDYFALKVLDRFRFVFKIIGVDYPVMRRILQLKFLMDSRRVPSVIRSRRKPENEDKNYFLSSLWLYLFTGLFMLFFLFFGNNYLVMMTIIFAVFMFMLASAMISDFSNVILDIRDKSIILTKPVSGKTLSMAKAIHVFVYLFYITLAIAGPFMLVTLVAKGIFFFLLLFAEIVLMDLFIVVVTSLLYIVILQFFDGEKLKDIINYMQIVTAIVVAGGYQVVFRIFNFTGVSIQFTLHWWMYLLPPVWFSGPFELFLHSNRENDVLVFSVLTVLVPLCAFLVYLKTIPLFEQNLQKLNNVKIKEEKYRKERAIGKLYRVISDRLARIFLATKEERIFYRFATDMIRQERDFKLRVYPALGLSIIFPLIFILNAIFGSGPHLSFSELPYTKYYLYIYFSAFMIPAAVINLQYSAKYKGAWIYSVTDTAGSGFIYKGVLKAFVMRLIIPVFILESAVFLLIFHWHILPDLFAFLLVELLFVVLYARIGMKHLPFSESYDNAKRSQGAFIFVILLCIGVLVGIHFVALLFLYGIYGYIIFLFIINLIVWKTGFRNKIAQ